MAKPDISLSATAPLWIEGVLADFPSFLQDHASCEKKASGMALNVASHYPDRPRLLAAMADLAVEELSHYREVVRVMLQHGLHPGADAKDPYINALQSHIRRGSDYYLFDRLLVAAIVECRGAERFGLIRDAISQPDSPWHALHGFYKSITASEGRHWQTFVELAQAECVGLDAQARLSELATAEAEIIRNLPFRPALH